MFFIFFTQTYKKAWVGDFAEEEGPYVSPLLLQSNGSRKTVYMPSNEKLFYSLSACKLFG